MLLTLSILGIFLSVILVYFNLRKYPSSIYLGGFFFLISLYGFIQYTLLYSKSVILISIVFINIGFLTYFTGPMLYWYVRSLITDDSRFKKRDLWHFIPMILYLAGSLSYLITPWSFKTQVASHLVDSFVNVRDFQQAGIYQYFPRVYVFSSRPLLVLGYAFWSAFLFIRFLVGKNDIGVFSGQRVLTRWMLMLLGFLTILATGQLFLIIRSYSAGNLVMFYTLNSLQLLSGIGLTGLLISPFFFPEILYGLPRPPKSAMIVQSENQPSVGAAPETKKPPPIFELDYLLSFNLKIDACLQEFRPYLQPDFNLNHLSALIHIPTHHLAYYFRKVKKQSFNDYRNELRVNYAKTLILEGKAKGMTLEAIGILSGFITRNTFFKAFKKVEGVSPSVFLAQNDREFHPIV
jgi:AraC-like DNA-binding protein